MRPRHVVVLLAAAIFAHQARAEFYSGTKLLQLLEAGDRVDRGVGMRGDAMDAALGMGFVAGVYDVYVDASFCSRPGVSLGQASAVALMYLRAIPHRNNEVAYGLVKEAFDRAWPCDRRQQPGRNL